MDQPEGQSTTFLRYQDVNFLDAVRTETMEPEKIRRSLLGAVRYGKPLVLDMSDVNMYKTLSMRFDEIQKGLLQSIMDKSFIEQELYLQLVKPEDGDDYDKYMFNDVNKFKFIILSQNPAPEEDLLCITFPIKVV
ncbi:putative IQ motif and ankyrin repeat domain-containing protein [Lamellibrachia satsuma]|nr:putative IQ motif and ankyrin repeat domain-containing protein [Lamellibrachia satsuma]